MKNYYDILGIPGDAKPDEIKAAYRKLARQYHPDMGECKECEPFIEIQEAYETLSNLQKKKEYDRKMRRSELPELRPSLFKRPRNFTKTPVYSHPSHDFWEEFNNIFSHFARESFHYERHKLELELILNTLEARSGGSIPVNIPFAQRCPYCQGTGEIWWFLCDRCGGSGKITFEKSLIIKIPPNVKTGETLHYHLDSIGLSDTLLLVNIRVSG